MSATADDEEEVVHELSEAQLSELVSRIDVMRRANATSTASIFGWKVRTDVYMMREQMCISIRCGELPR